MKRLPLSIIGTVLSSFILASCSNFSAPDNSVNKAEVPSSIDRLALSSTELAVPLWDSSLLLTAPMDFQGGELIISPLASDKTIGINLAISQEFDITRPTAKITTTYDKYFITGTSDPKIPVYFEGEEIERQGSKGVFGVLASLEMGENKFTFKQGDEARNVTITRKAYVNPAAIPISEIQQSSMVPAEFAGAKAGGELVLSCVAPSGALVTAAFDGHSIKLKQVAEAKTGVPALFKATMTIDKGYSDDTTEKIGKVTYSLEYKGSTKKYTSTGDVYVAGENSAVAVRVKNYMGFVYPNTGNLSIFKEKLKLGAADYLKSQDNTYVELYSGGYVNKNQLEVITGKVSVNNKFSKVKFTGKSKYETYTFSGTNKPAYATKISDGKFYITFYNTTGEPVPAVANSKLFSDVSVKSDERYVTYVFTQKNSNLWGYNVSYGENGTVLTFKYKPRLSSGDKPFEGMTVVLDPGHGGTDVGALGVAALKGPTETDFNLAHAYAVRDALESMGAKVAMTRWKDEYYSLDDRLRAPEATNADFFVSIHHNSIGENADANKISGVEVYYHSAMNKKLANSMMTAVTKDSSRKPRFVQQSYYRVTLSPYSPAILLELGFMSNPLEYERATNKTQIDKVAKAIVNGIRQTLAS